MEEQNWISIIGLITGIASIVLAVISIMLSLVFYRWSEKHNKDMASMSKTITERTDYLGKLFDKMFDATFSLVKEDSDAMRRHLFSTGETHNTPDKNAQNTLDESHLEQKTMNSPSSSQMST